MPEPYSTLDSQEVLQFASDVLSVAQQRVSFLTPYCVKRTINEGKYMQVKRRGQMARPIEKTQQFQDANLTNHSWDSRWGVERWFYHVLGVDAQNEKEIGRSLTPELVEDAVSSLMREVDLRIYEAAEATVRVGQDPVSGSDLTATNDGVTVIDATSGFDSDVLAELRKNYDDAGVTQDIGRVVGADGSPNDYLLLITGTEKQALLSETQLTSSDFISGKPMESGNISRVHGINLMEYAANVQDPLMPAASSERRLLSVARGGLSLALEMPSVVIQDRTDKIATKQAVLQMRLCVLRNFGNRIQIVRVAA